VGARVTVDVAVASAPLAGETESGDAAVVLDAPGRTLVAAVDGLGHGPPAAKAARAVTAALQQAPGDPLQRLFQRCHQAASATRGAALTLACIDAERPVMSWLAVGNVAGVLVRQGAGARQSVVARPGIVGASLPPLHPGQVELEDGDTLVLATDGLTVGFAKAVQPHLAPQASADRLLAEWSRGGDDALVLVARYARTG
jgi:negative regulator of sigma-B (phosphoserine phosphatase)